MRGALLIGVAVVVFILLPLKYLVPPLEVGTPEQAHEYAAVRFLSGGAQAGEATFGAHCSRCHGADATGGDGGPGLTDKPYALDFRNARDFHAAVGRRIAAHEGLIGEFSTDPSEAFNEMERMGKFLRELHLRERREAE